MQSNHEPMANKKQDKPQREDKKRSKKGYNREAIRNSKREGF